MSKESERERLQRIRDAQVKARDPGKSKIRGYDWDQHAQRGKVIEAKRQKEQKPLLIDLFLLLPGRWQGALTGGLIGLIPLIVAQLLLSAEWALLGVVGLIVCGVVGFVIGSLLEPDEVDLA